MTNALIWLHEDALSDTHPVFEAAGQDVRAVHLWDDAYLQAHGYSLKRLVFLYETLCELPVDIVAAEALKYLKNQHEQIIFIPESPNPFIRDIAATLRDTKTVHMVAEIPYVHVESNQVFKRFFPFWKKVQSQTLGKF